MIIKFTTDAPYIRAFFNWLKRQSGRRKLLSMDKCKSLARIIPLVLLFSGSAHAFTEVRDQRGELSPVIVSETWSTDDYVYVEAAKPHVSFSKPMKPQPTPFLMEQPKPHKSVLIPMYDYPERMGSTQEDEEPKRGLVGPSMGWKGPRREVTSYGGSHITTWKFLPNQKSRQ